jgi:GNAT superfamily N-acetyltransferase
MLMGCLAVDRAWQGRGRGRALLQDAVLHTLKAAEIAALRALLVHALDADAARFYRADGFLAAPIDPFVLMLPLETARRGLG